MTYEEIQTQLDSVWKGWVVDDLIGEGSYGFVYRIHREEFGHIYESALKVITIPQSVSEYKAVLNEGMDEESAAAYFYSVVEQIVDELTLMSRLKGNTNIVSYEDHAIVPIEGKFGWNIYIRMELLMPLLDYFIDNTMSIRKVIQMGIDICSSLEVCQKYNIIHRDVKPENIFVTKLGNFKLGDFGIAKQMEKTTGNMSRRGTTNYMAPEVYKGESYGSTVDIYSLGLVLYRFLNNNRLPFLPTTNQLSHTDKEEAIIKRMSGTAVPTPCNARGRLGEIVVKACSYNSKDRYDSAADMKQALSSILYTVDETELIYPEGDSLTKPHTNKDKVEVVNPGDGIEGTATATYIEGSYSTIIEDENNEIVNDKNVPDGNKRKRFVIGFASLVVVATIVLLSALVFSSTTKVPNFIGLSLDEANKIVQEKQYRLTIDYTGEEYSDSYAKGKIISQSVPDGTTVKKGDSIQVIISRGAIIKVPDVAGIDKKDASLILDETGLVYNVTEDYSDTVPVNRVISQSISAESVVEEGTVINLVVSKGKEQVKIPDVTGLDIAEAEQIISDNGLECEITEEYNENTEKNVVISQNYKAGTMVDKGVTIILVKSLGNKPVTKSSTTGSKTKKSNDDDEVIWKDAD
ncbi:MAG: PASTA domain-containing protein [Lachnospiraceae bacterium]|nr:PASTA domain-containing protein [Lachnospiraceae bacterium]